MKASITNPIYFVGAGPGDPDLITVKGRRKLEEADLIIYAGSLVPEAVLKWARQGCVIENSASMHLEAIVDTMIDAQKAGKRVVRLHTGDPALYGAISEQMEFLDQAEIEYKVVPGVTAAFAASAAMAMEYTLPEVTQTLIFTRMSGRTPVPEKEALETLAAHQASMAIYLSITLIEEVATVLIKAYGEEATAAVAFRVSQPEEKILYTPLKDLVDTVRSNNINHQALIIVGKPLEGRNKGTGLTHKSRLYAKEFTHAYRQGA